MSLSGFSDRAKLVANSLGSRTDRIRQEVEVRKLSGVEATNPDLAQSVSPPMPAMVKLELDGVSSPIIAKVAHHAHDLVTIEQELPFLMLGKGARVSGSTIGDRRGRLESVELRIEGNTPRLVLAVIYDDDAGVSALAPSVEIAQRLIVDTGDATLPDFEAATSVTRAAPMHR